MIIIKFQEFLPEKINRATRSNILYYNAVILGILPYLRRLTGLPDDNLLNLMGWMVAINPIGQVKHIRIINVFHLFFFSWKEYFI